MWVPFLNWLVEITASRRLAVRAEQAAQVGHQRSRIVMQLPPGDPDDPPAVGLESPIAGRSRSNAAAGPETVPPARKRAMPDRAPDRSGEPRSWPRPGGVDDAQPEPEKGSKVGTRLSTARRHSGVSTAARVNSMLQPAGRRPRHRPESHVGPLPVQSGCRRARRVSGRRTASPTEPRQRSQDSRCRHHGRHDHGDSARTLRGSAPCCARASG